MKITDELLSAYLDREVSTEEEHYINDALEEDEVLAKRVSDLRRASSCANVLLSEIDERPLPDDLQKMINQMSGASSTPTENVVEFPVEETKKLSDSNWLLPLAASIALLVGFSAGNITSLKGGSENLEQLAYKSLGLVQESDPLKDILEEKPSGSPYRLAGLESTTVTPILSFVAVDGSICRELVVSNLQTASRGVFCRGTSGDWTTIAMAKTIPERQSDFIPASDSANAGVDAVIDQIISGEPFDLTDETNLLANDWNLKH